MPANAEALCIEADQLKAEMSAYMSTWQDCAEFAMPLRRLSFNATGTPYKADHRLQTGVATEALNTLASGLLSWVTPSRQNWFNWKPADGMDGNGALSDWLADCTRRAHLALANSNFYTVVHTGNLDLGGFGTVGIYAEAGKERALNFKCWHTGTFACAENEEGQVDRVFRFFKLTSQQAVDRFGEDAPKICRDQVESNKKHEKHEFIHCVFPRTFKDRPKEGGPKSKPVACVYLYAPEKKVVQEDGYDSMPVAVSRWLKVDESPYGISPTMISIGDIRGGNWLETQMAAIANLKLNPRVIAQTGTLGVVDLGPGGVTQVSSMRDKPEIWGDPSEYKIGLDLLSRIDERINKAFHTDLFTMFSKMDDETTATLTRARAGEQLARITPAITLQTTDLINPLVERIFMILFQGGHFLPPPREAFVQDSAEQNILVYPKAVQISRMQQAIEDSNVQAFESTMGVFIPFLELQPEVLDNVDLDTAFRETAKGRGVPPSYLLKVEDRDAKRQARAEQAQQQQVMEMATKQPELAMQAVAAAGGQAA